MSDAPNPVDAGPVIDIDALEERRAKRDLKHFMVKAMTITVMILIVASTSSLIYAAVVQEKDLDTGFIGDLFKTVFDFLRFLMT